MMDEEIDATKFKILLLSYRSITSGSTLLLIVMSRAPEQPGPCDVNICNIFRKPQLISSSEISSVFNMLFETGVPQEDSRKVLLFSSSSYMLMGYDFYVARLNSKSYSVA